MTETKLQQQYEDLHARATDAIDHWDAVPAWGTYRELEKFLGRLPTGQPQEASLAQEIATLKRGLLAVGFPALPRDEAVKLFREHLLDFFRVDVDFKERLLTRYTFVGYGEKDEERLKLKAAISQNGERLGAFTVGQWVKFFDERFHPEKQSVPSAPDFLTKTGEVAALRKEEQAVLRQILSVYEECLAKPVLDDFDKAVVSGESLQQSGSARSLDRRSENAAASAGEEAGAVKVPLLQALSKYEQLGNQLITRERIRIKSQPEPVRPSLLYWLKYYRDELGVGYHDNVQRGSLLFRSENGKKLSAQERERINLILKSVEENFPLSIDTERQEIIFPAFQGVLAGERPPRLSPRFGEAGGEARSEPPAAPQHARVVQNTAFFVPEKAKENAHTEYASGGLRIGRGTTSSVPPTRTASPVEIGSVNFSTAHVFPAEREVAENRAVAQVQFQTPPQPTVRPIQPAPPSVPKPTPKKTEPGPSPFRIHPVSLGEKDEGKWNHE